MMAAIKKAQENPALQNKNIARLLPKIILRGGGDLATGVAHRLHNAGYKFLVLECARPTAIRRQVAICEAVYAGEAVVENMRAVLIKNLAEAENIWQQNAVPVLVDENAACAEEFAPAILIDAIIAKKNLGMKINMAQLVIALGPGFTAGMDVHAVIETKRGHNLGRIITSGSAAPNSGVPGMIAGYAKERVLHAPCAGIFRGVKKIGDFVEKNEIICEIKDACGENIPVRAELCGIIRGMLRDDFIVTRGFKIADIDPRREELANCFTISDKARCIAGSVLELVNKKFVENILAAKYL